MLNRRFLRFFALFGLSIVGVIGIYFMVFPPTLEPPSVSAQSSAQSRPFAMTQFLFYKEAPGFDNYGIEKMSQLGNPQDYWVNPLNPVDFPDEQKTRQRARTVPPENYYFVDIEHLPFDNVAVDAAKLAKIGEWIRAERPKLKFGFYGVPPITSPWNRPARWRAINAQLHPIVKDVDFVMPDLYTVHADRKDWLAQAKDTIAEARQYNKPIYAFIMPVYHPGAGADMSGKPIPGDYWRFQLETLYQYADGVVIWSWNPDVPWKSFASETDPNNWWYQTLDFIKQHQIAPTPKPN